MLEIYPIKAFSDNYLWLFKQSDSIDACIVDPGDAFPVLAYLKQEKLNLTAILLTHHHPDHVGGVNELLKHYDVPVYGPESSAIPTVTQALHEGDSIVAGNTRFAVLEIPGHTLDHIAYFADAESDQLPTLFCGDTLFAGGCGRIFEGTPVMMYDSLQKLAALNPATQVYCAHEYTLSNLAFAEAVLPEDSALQQRIQLEKEKREYDIPTVPSSISVELETNPFLRAENQAIIDAVRSQSGNQRVTRPDEVFAILRQLKDDF
ncbi:hydroxyacylglutathione hydrolase [Haliea sp. AH-315-K21]|uniref:Hydroxyacylglutathione hydrolase n=1 Tax=SAR86 cluster bacterium TaxID=2030880 RepID=A0A2A5C832_9GAMM|nr:hydroxyacylglutathione hydrolase [Haliea sp. AH-315-K21]PCJ39638.1 MAG: hydroxyacylglutathione hydrolase [SAR86 cluster bacterium]